MAHSTTKKKKSPRLPQIGLALALVLMIGGYFLLTVSAGCTYTIVDGDTTIQVSSAAASAEEILKEAGISLREGDQAVMTGGSARGQIVIQRAQHIVIQYGGTETQALFFGGTVGELLEEQSIVLSPGDSITSQGTAVSTAAPTYDGMTLSIGIVTTTEEVSQEAIPFETVTYLDASLEAGTIVEDTPGQDGLRQITKTLTYINGVLTSTEITGAKVLREPVRQVMLSGSLETLEEDNTALEIYVEPSPSPSPQPETRKNDIQLSGSGSSSAASAVSTPAPAATPAPTPVPTPTPAAASGKTVTTASGQVLSYSRTLSVTATAYTGGGTTATGTAARYGAIAVDPSVIPYGTRMYIVSDDGKWVYGVATAEDCGGAIQGNIIDLYFDTYEECIQFGRRSCTVYILD